MENTGFLKTVSFGGFNKQDVLAYVDDLNTKIYKLEAELDEAKKNMEQNGDVASFDGVEAYEEMLAKERQKSSELMAKVDTLNLTIQSNNSVLIDKDNELSKRGSEIEELTQKISNLEGQLAATPKSDDATSLDIGNIFIEAQKSANKVLSDAKAAAREMDENSKNLADQVITEANEKAETLVAEANLKATKILRAAERKGVELEKAAGEVKEKVKHIIESMFNSVMKINDSINEFSRGSLSNLEKAKTLIIGVQQELNEQENELYTTADNTFTMAGMAKSGMQAGVRPSTMPSSSMRSGTVGSRTMGADDGIPESVLPRKTSSYRSDDLANLLAQVEAEATSTEDI